MELTTAERYGVRIMVDIAQCNGEIVSIADISKRQNVSTKYVEKIISGLRKSNLVESSRGVNGGYRLAKSPKETTLLEIFMATGDKMEIVKCLSQDCSRSSTCETKTIWNNLNDVINKYLNSVTLQDLLDKNL